MDLLQILKNGFDPKLLLARDLAALRNAESAIQIGHGVEVEVRQ